VSWGCSAPLLNESQERTDDTEFDLNIEWNGFVGKEMGSWDTPEDHTLLVRPSGLLKSPIVMHLHYPTFKTRIINNGEIFDGSPCIRIIQQAGFNVENSFWVDTLARWGKAPFNPGTSYSAAQVAIHREWLMTIRNASKAQVELVFGKENMLDLKTTLEPLLEKSTLWDSEKPDIY
jgi:hypothetical protein